MGFDLVSDFTPTGDQPQAINKLSQGIKKGYPQQVLLGVTGSGKTYTMANVIAQVNKPTLIISHNKTLAAQLYTEFEQFFPHNAVEYFVSYYDYYQPEAYVPQIDLYIEKDASINENIDRLRLKATNSLIERRDVIIVASVSCIYNIGSPEEYKELVLVLEVGEEKSRPEILKSLVAIHYERNDTELAKGRFRVRGDVIEIVPAYLENVLRIELFGDAIERVTECHPVTGKILARKDRVVIYPARHFVTSRPRLEAAITAIKKELGERVKWFKQQGKLLEAQRLEQRTNYDLEMMLETGYCHGIENYSRHLSGRSAGERPFCLIDYFPEDYLVIIDESHVTIPQLNGMYNGDRARKETLVEYGFRLPSALDNRPLKFSEFEKLVQQVIYVSATPAEWEMKKCRGRVAELIVRPTGLVDPEVIIKPTGNQIDDLIEEINRRVAREERILVTTLTKRMAEDLSDYLLSKNLRVRYLHSEIQTLQRVEILRDLRKGEFDCLVGINLLREGLDLPEVSLVAVLDADKEGFLRSETSLIQVCGRAARNVNGQIIMYADEFTGSLDRAIKEMNRRRQKQILYNKRHKITPRTIKKVVQEENNLLYEIKHKAAQFVQEQGYYYAPRGNVNQLINDLKSQMQEAADKLDFEMATILRDKLFELTGKKRNATTEDTEFTEGRFFKVKK